MTTAILFVAYPGFEVLGDTVFAWRVLSIVLLAIVFIWWKFDRAALDRRIRRLEARSEIADERRVTAETGLMEVEHKLDEVAGRVVDMENFAGPYDSPAPNGAAGSGSECRLRKRVPFSRAL